MTAGDLYVLVKNLLNRSGADPIVSSAAVKNELTERGIPWDATGRAGGLLEQADNYVKRDGRLQRWKHGTGETDEVGWSMSERHNPDQYWRAVAWAAENGWHSR